MKKQFAPLVAILSVLAFLAWIFFTVRDDQSGFELEGPSAVSVPVPSTVMPLLQDQTGGSQVPCAIPLAWRIARVDESFGLSREEAREAFEKAATLWKNAVGSGLFSNETNEGLPIRFVYDERQERTQERSRLVRDFNEASATLEARRVELEVERATLMDRGREIDGLRQRWMEDSVRLDREVEAHRREGQALEATFPVTRVQSGVYREAVHTQGGEVTSVTREIRIFRFEGLDDLVRVAAHELGHALGLGHSAVPGSLMREEFVQTVLSEGTPSVQPGDVEALRALCPEL